MTPEIEAKVEELLPQARSEAWRIFQQAPQQLEREELGSLAYLGLVMAASRWEVYCAENKFSPGCGQVPCTDPAACGSRYFAAYALRRMRGSMLDSMRSSDWLSRSMRTRAKALRDAGQDIGATEEQLSERTSLTKRQIRDTQAAVARRPVSVDAEPVDIAEPGSVEGQVVVSAVLGAAAGALEALPLAVQVVIALRYHQGLELRDVAAQLLVSEEQVTTWHAEGVLAVHEAMARTAAEGAV